jgi:glutaredoxin
VAFYGPKPAFYSDGRLTASADALVMGEPILRLIVAPDCHLCEHARAVLASLSLAVRMVDVASDEAQQLASRGVPLVLLPVLCDGEHVIAYGRLSERALRKRLAA